MFFSKGCSNKVELLEATDVSEGRLPLKDVGILLSVNYLKARYYTGLIDKCREKVEGWMSKSLSGRVELIRSVIFGAIHCWIQAFKFPVSVIKALERLCANFLWRNKMHAGAWEKLCKPKKERVVAIRRI